MAVPSSSALRYLIAPVALPYTLTAVFWLCALGILCLRRFSRVFRRLVCYGGRVSVDDSTTAASGGADAAVPAMLAAAVCSVRFLSALRLGRRDSFVLFYAVGGAAVGCLVLGNARLAHADSVTQTPLCLFGVHCLWRLVETVFVFRFRGKEDDNVSLFAALSGSVFYVFAALSCNAVVQLQQPLGGGRTKANGRLLQLEVKVRLSLTAAMNVLALLYLLVQVVQAWVHASLARLRSRPGTAEDDTNNARQVAVTVRQLKEAYQAAALSANRADAASVPVLTEPKLLSYRFPSDRNPLFTYVLEPHYACEVLLYVINLITVYCVLWAYQLSASCGGHRVDGERDDVNNELCAELERAAALRMSCAVGVLVFSALNLAMTAQEHRAFWLRANAERRKAARLLKEYRAATAPAAEAAPDAAETQQSRACAAVLREESLPKWNVLYGIC